MSDERRNSPRDTQIDNLWKHIRGLTAGYSKLRTTLLGPDGRNGHRGRIEAIEGRLDEIDDKIVALDRSIRARPTRQDLNRFKQEVNQEMKVVREDMASTAKELRGLVEGLRKHWMTTLVMSAAVIVSAIGGIIIPLVTG